MNGFSVRTGGNAARPMGLSLLLVAFVALAIFYSLIIPLFEGPDEDDHFRYAKFLSDQHTLPVQEFVDGGGAAGHQGWQPPLYYSLAALLISPIDTSDYAQHLWRNEGWAAVGDPACCGRNIYYHTDNEAFPFTGTTLAVHLARLLAVCFGAITVAATYWLVEAFVVALTLTPGESAVDARRLLPLAAASVVAFNPSFLFASALVSNDTLLAALSALVLLLWVRMLVGQSAPNVKSAALLGALIGLALLTKTTALALIPFSLAVFGVAAWRQRDYRTLVFGSALMLGVVALVSGWWFVRNTVLYGDPLAYRLMTVSAIFPRSGPLTLPELFRISLPWLWQTFWGGPTPGDFSPVLLAVLLLVIIVASFGFAVFAIKSGFHTRITIAFLVAWLGAILIAQVQFIRTTVGADQGRYLFPAIPVFGMVLALGLGTLAGRRMLTRFVPSAIILAMFLLAVFVPFAYTVPAYAHPAFLTPDQVARIQHPMDVDFAEQIQLLGYDLDARSVHPGETLSVALYWRALAPMSESYRVFVHLIAVDDASAGGADVIPARGAFPTVYWKPGDMLRDLVQIPVAPDARAGEYMLEIGLYPVGKPGERLIVTDSGDDHVLADAIKVAPPQPVTYTPQTRTDALFGEQAKLIGYDARVEGDSLRLVLYWQDIARFERDYKVFVHAVDPDGQIIAQADHEPQDGNYPTSIWDVGEEIRDEYVLPLKASDSYTIELGMYRPDTDERLRVRVGGNESDHVEFEVPGAVP